MLLRFLGSDSVNALKCNGALTLFTEIYGWVSPKL